jgi:hypothetical protein
MKSHLLPVTRITLNAFLLIAVALIACSCTTIQDAQEVENPKDTPPELVGIIASIPPDRKFVLIQSYGPWDVSIGSILTTRGEQGRTANLLFTGEKLGQFAAADIQSGTVERGDGVYTLHIPKPMAESLPAPTDTPTTNETTPEEISDPALPQY